MYFLDDRSMRRDLALDRQPTSDVAIYLLLGSSLSIPIFYPAPYESTAGFLVGWVTALSAVCSFVIAVWGVRQCFYANGGNNGLHFAERFISLSWVVGCQIALPTVPVLLVAVFLAPEFLAAYVELIFLPLFVVYYLRTSKLIEKTKAESEQIE